MDPARKPCHEIVPRDSAHRSCQEMPSRDLAQRSSNTPPSDILRWFFAGILPADLAQDLQKFHAERYCRASLQTLKRELAEDILRTDC